jgi:hypothetical protein
MDGEKSLGGKFLHQEAKDAGLFRQLLPVWGSFYCLLPKGAESTSILYFNMLGQNE